MIYYYFAFFLDRQKHIIYAACDVYCVCIYIYMRVSVSRIHCTSVFFPHIICTRTRFFFRLVFFVNIIYTTRDRLQASGHRVQSHVCRKTISESSRDECAYNKSHAITAAARASTIRMGFAFVRILLGLLLELFHAARFRFRFE